MDQQVNIELFKVDPSDFKKISKSINGGCASITFMTQISTNKKVVLKQYEIRRSSNLFYQAVKTHAICQHKGIIDFVGWNIGNRNKGNLYLKAANKGSLQSIISDCQKGNPDPLFDNTHKLIIAYGVACAMNYLHSMNILHRDIDSGNILLNGKLYPYLSGFSTSIRADDVMTEEEIQATTPRIMAPEFLENYEKYSRTKPIDVYSYGMVLYQLLTEQEINNNESNIVCIEKVIRGERPKFPSDNSPSENWQKLICACWDQVPENRPTFEQICDILETPDFVTPDIDSNLFNIYKNKVNNYQSAEVKHPQISDVDQIKEAAEKGNADAQNSYALHLYNGLGVIKDREMARHYFELSADNGNHDAQFYFSLILAREGDTQRSTNYYQKSIDSSVPEAISCYAQQLIGENKIDESIQYLSYALQRGSISAMISFGNICEANSKYGCQDIFYDMASCCCHCLDKIGFYFPIDYKIYQCKDCGIDMCEGCAKSCHKSHRIVEKGIDHSFVCNCGKKHFKDDKYREHCSIEYVGEMLCDDQPVCYQHFYRCMDCSKSKDEFICRSCARNCHQNHKVVDLGIQRGFCSCGSDKCQNEHKCKSSYYLNSAADKCTNEDHNNAIRQRWFQCMSCGLYNSNDHGFCKSCAEKCHKGHLVLDRGVKRNSCNCYLSNNCQLKK